MLDGTPVYEEGIGSLSPIYNFVIDTNVIRHDYNWLKNFQENDIYLPIVVLEELDK